MHESKTPEKHQWQCFFRKNWKHFQKNRFLKILSTRSKILSKSKENFLNSIKERKTPNVSRLRRAPCKKVVLYNKTPSKNRLIWLKSPPEGHRKKFDENFSVSRKVKNTDQWLWRRISRFVARLSRGYQTIIFIFCGKRVQFCWFTCTRQNCCYISAIPPVPNLFPLSKRTVHNDRRKWFRTMAKVVPLDYKREVALLQGLKHQRRPLCWPPPFWSGGGYRYIGKIRGREKGTRESGCDRQIRRRRSRNINTFWFLSALKYNFSKSDWSTITMDALIPISSIVTDVSVSNVLDQTNWNPDFWNLVQAGQLTSVSEIGMRSPTIPRLSLWSWRIARYPAILEWYSRWEKTSCLARCSHSSADACLYNAGRPTGSTTMPAHLEFQVLTSCVGLTFSDILRTWFMVWAPFSYYRSIWIFIGNFFVCTIRTDTYRHNI